MDRKTPSQKQILKQLPEPQRLTAQILDERWNEVAENCPDRNDFRCTLSGESCEFQNCPKLAEKGRKGGDFHGGR
ncbi:hypothetical protein AKJ65_00320 [candidate division MSBL1 archaeon SCGC-AAA259E19]|uniref:Uncharacterized protein n=1 Tax=candidate division MSBL1 archaeon SCGC-AAA259E19 TaxID=1698264 RepID=A0A133UNV8_9EURY|nr:hypothetical protein AKJ65_00320 [candidate division MSBL1 archaeon SCGC-AAA259E19]